MAVVVFIVGGEDRRSRSRWWWLQQRIFHKNYLTNVCNWIRRSSVPALCVTAAPPQPHAQLLVASPGAPSRSPPPSSWSGPSSKPASSQPFLLTSSFLSPISPHPIAYCLSPSSVSFRHDGDHGLSSLGASAGSDNWPGKWRPLHPRASPLVCPACRRCRPATDAPAPAVAGRPRHDGHPHPRLGR